MKKTEILRQILIILSIVLGILFVVFLTIDLKEYQTYNSTPLSKYLLIRGLQFLLPGLILFGASFILKSNKKSKNENIETENLIVEPESSNVELEKEIDQLESEIAEMEKLSKNNKINNNKQK